jgi:hypothetical protein
LLRPVVPECNAEENEPHKEDGQFLGRLCELVGSLIDVDDIGSGTTGCTSFEELSPAKLL